MTPAVIGSLTSLALLFASLAITVLTLLLRRSREREHLTREQIDFCRRERQDLIEAYRANQ